MRCVWIPAFALVASMTLTPGLHAQDRIGPTDPAELEGFLDGLMAAHRAELGIAGATVAVVRDGELLLSKGYGWADVEARRPVDPASTLFRIGSVTKPFTWTAVMQLEEQGLLDLDTDVNEYLDFQVPGTWEEPITLRHLLTHTPGFEDRAYGLFGPNPGVSRGAWFRDNIPARVRPPGEYTSYSNYGTGLAGYIVERVSGLEWEAYLEERILGPLGMEHATARQPLPEHLAPLLSEGYAYEGGAFRPRPFEWVDSGAPAGAMSASADAMARFMIAHLEGGEVDGVRILGESAVDRMHERAFASDPRVNGMTLGLYEKSSHGLRIVGHSGGTQWFFTDMALIPEERLGIFVSYNSAGAAPLPMGRFLEAFLDRYYPVERGPTPDPSPGWQERAAAYAGTYGFLRVSHTTFERILGPLIARISVRPGESAGEMTVRSPFGTERYREVEPGHLRSVDGHGEVAFEGSPEAGYTHLFLSHMPPAAAERIGFADRGGVHLVLLLFAILIFASLPAVMLGRWLLARRFEEVLHPRGPERWLRWAGLGFVGVVVLFVLLLGVGIASQEAFLYGEGRGVLRAALLVSLLLLPLLLALVAGAALAVQRRLWGTAGRVHFVLFVLAAVTFVLQLHHWNLLGPRM